jgi:hypothetical protein
MLEVECEQIGQLKNVLVVCIDIGLDEAEQAQ